MHIQLSKLDLIKDARNTFNELKKEHYEKLRQQKEEADMFLRIQMEQKMELSRQQKKVSFTLIVILFDKRRLMIFKSPFRISLE